MDSQLNSIRHSKKNWIAYVAKGADVSGCTRHSGSWSVLSSALSFDYLWNEVRVKGGAYISAKPEAKATMARMSTAT